MQQAIQTANRSRLLAVSIIIFTQRVERMKSLSLSVPALSSRAAVAAAVTALALTGCANYFGMKSDKQMSSPAQYESARSLPSESGQWPSLDWLAIQKLAMAEPTKPSRHGD